MNDGLDLAGRQVHVAILKLKKAGEAEDREPPETASPDAAGTAGTQALARLVQEEKNTPTTEGNVERNRTLVDAIISTGQKHYLSRSGGVAIKAMQDYARGKVSLAVSLLESAAKLDPDSRDIAKALERLRKER